MTNASLPIASQARVTSDRAQGYLIQLCKHFGHKTEASFADNRRRIRFTAGLCELDAEDQGVLAITLSTADPAQLATLEDVLERHLRRFAFRQELAIQWIRAPGA